TSHRVERNVLSSLHGTTNTPCILLREKPFWNNGIQINTKAGSEDRNEQRKWLVAQDPSQADAIRAEQMLECPFAGAIKASMLFLVNRTKKFRAHRRRSG